jgi:hypothetical protein
MDPGPGVTLGKALVVADAVQLRLLLRAARLAVGGSVVAGQSVSLFINYNNYKKLPKSTYLFSV